MDGVRDGPRNRRRRRPTRSHRSRDHRARWYGIAVQCDHADDQQIVDLFARIAEEQSGRLDLLVNNVWANPAGYAGFADPFWKRPIDDWDSLIGIGLRAHYVASVEAAKLMVPRGSGVFGIISSFGTRGYLHSVLYGMSKAGLDKWDRELRRLLTGRGRNPGIRRPSHHCIGQRSRSERAQRSHTDHRRDGRRVRNHRRQRETTGVTPQCLRWRPAFLIHQ